jgi:hypothetical protein
LKGEEKYIFLSIALISIVSLKRNGANENSLKEEQGLNSELVRNSDCVVLLRIYPYLGEIMPGRSFTFILPSACSTYNRFLLRL